jgi:hypothetical protein
VILGVLFFCLAMIAILPLIIIVVPIAECSGGGFAVQLACFLEKFDSILLSLGTLFLVSSLALFTTYIANKSSEKRDVFNRRIQTELQVAQFRQDWINKMHRDLSDLFEIMICNVANDSDAGLARLNFSIQSRLNLENPLAKLVDDIIIDYFTGVSDKDSELEMDAISRLAPAANEFLKGEWDELKLKLETAQSIEIDTPQ